MPPAGPWAQGRVSHPQRRGRDPRFGQCPRMMQHARCATGARRTKPAWVPPSRRRTRHDEQAGGVEHTRAGGRSERRPHCGDHAVGQQHIRLERSVVVNHCAAPDQQGLRRQRAARRAPSVRRGDESALEVTARQPRAQRAARSSSGTMLIRSPAHLQRAGVGRGRCGAAHGQHQRSHERARCCSAQRRRAAAQRGAHGAALLTRQRITGESAREAWTRSGAAGWAPPGSHRATLPCRIALTARLWLASRSALGTSVQHARCERALAVVPARRAKACRRARRHLQRARAPLRWR
jgi:hypothetical protein